VTPSESNAVLLVNAQHVYLDASNSSPVSVSSETVEKTGVEVRRFPSYQDQVRSYLQTSETASKRSSVRCFRTLRRRRTL